MNTPRLRATLLRWKAVNDSLDRLTATRRKMVVASIEGQSVKEIAKLGKFTQARTVQILDRAWADLDAALFETTEAASRIQ